MQMWSWRASFSRDSWRGPLIAVKPPGGDPKFDARSWCGRISSTVYMKRPGGTRANYGREFLAVQRGDGEVRRGERNERTSVAGAQRPPAPAGTKRAYRGMSVFAWPTAMMERPNSRFPARMKGTRFPDRSDRCPNGIRKRALAAAWHVKINPVWAMEIPVSRAYRGKKAKRDPHA